MKTFIYQGKEIKITNTGYITSDISGFPLFVISAVKFMAETGAWNMIVDGYTIERKRAQLKRAA